VTQGGGPYDAEQPCEASGCVLEKVIPNYLRFRLELQNENHFQPESPAN
jgi:hypothetical protein